jgi:hypothetical protein
MLIGRELSGAVGGQDADALDAEGLGGTLGGVGDELVLRVLLDGFDVTLYRSGDLARRWLRERRL